MSRRGAFAFVIIAGVALACSVPRITEDSDAECHNRVDDDGDGLIDCADPKCLAAGHCESTPDACANGIDDDNNGRTDCEDSTCIDQGYCAPRATDCNVDPPAGCVPGLVCSAPAKETKGTLCALPGTFELDQVCDAQGSCQSGLHCWGFCRRICRTEADCPRETFCVRNQRTSFGYCSTSCIPALNGADCPKGACVALSAFQTPFDGLEVGAVCADPTAWTGLVGEGGECNNPALISQLDKMCAPGLVCYPTPSGTPRCRTTCGINQEGRILIACPPGQRCGQAFPLDPRPPLVTQLFLGICEP